MEEERNFIGAFSEEHAEKLTGVSKHQLRKWDRLGLVRPSYGAEDSGLPYGRVYSFRDIVSLRVLAQLRNQLRVPEWHLLDVAKDLARYSDRPWASLRLHVLGRRVVVVEPGSRRKRLAAGTQMVLDLLLRDVIGNVRDAIDCLNKRDGSLVGKVVREKFVAQNQRVIAGTRVPIDAINSFADAGYSAAAIVREYPTLTLADVEAAIAYKRAGAAA